MTELNYNPDQLHQLLFPIGNKLLPHRKITSSLLRSTISKPINDNPKMLINVENSLLKVIAKNIKSLTNIKNKTTALRLIHGDIYCGTKLKKIWHGRQS